MDPVSEIKSRLNIGEVVGRYVALKPAGRNLKGLCPFHNDHDPSFLVSNEKGLAWCFVCQNGGDIFSFVQKVENVDFSEALKILADQAGVSLKNASHTEVVKKEKKLRLMELLDEAQSFFVERLTAAKGVQNKIAERQIAPEILQKFGVGYAPDDFHALEHFLETKGFSRKEMLEAGMVSTRDENGAEVYDRFRGRITFPIWDLHGSIRGFGARIFGEGEPKYLNSPETVLYQKSQILYGLNFAKEAIKRQDFCLVVEGYFDVIACHNAEIEGVVAASGVALTETHVKMIQRFSNTLLFAFDADTAGREATKRAIATAVKSGASVYILPAGGGKDPDEALRENRQNFLAQFSERIPVMEFLWHEALQGNDIRTVAGQRAVLDIIFPFLALFPGALERDYYLTQLAQKLQAPANILEKEFAAFRKKEGPIVQKTREIDPAPISAKIPRFSYLLGAISAFPELLPFVTEKFLIDLAPEQLEKRIYKAFSEVYNAAGVFEPTQVLKIFSPEEVQQWELWSLYAEEELQHLGEKGRQEAVRKVLRSLNREFIQHELQHITQTLKETPRGSSAERELQKRNIDFNRLLHHL